MSIIIDELTEGISTGIRNERDQRNWSLAELADRSEVSKAMISKIERGESSPTTAVLGRLCGAFGITLSTFLVRAEGQKAHLVRAADQPSWIDSETQTTRTLISPSAGGPIEIVTVDLPAGASVIFPASIYATFHQTIWVLSGQLTLLENELLNVLETGDCLELGSPTQVTFKNTSKKPCSYLVAATPRG